MKNMWMVRAGEKAFLYDEFKKRCIIAIGWGIGDVVDLTKDDIKELLKEKDPENVAINLKASIIIRFRDDLEKGDYVLAASPSSEKFLLGEITSDYYFSEELIEDNVDKDRKYNNLRKVNWLCEINSDELSESTTDYLGHLIQTLSKINEKSKEEILNFIDSPFGND